MKVRDDVCRNKHALMYSSRLNDPEESGSNFLRTAMTAGWSNVKPASRYVKFEYERCLYCALQPTDAAALDTGALHSMTDASARESCKYMRNRCELAATAVKKAASETGRPDVQRSNQHRPTAKASTNKCYVILVQGPTGGVLLLS